MLRILTIAAVAAVLAGNALAEEGAEGDNKTPAPIPDPQSFTSQHTGIFNGRRVRYTAIAGETYLKDDKGRPTGSIFSFSYIQGGVEDVTRRPVVFIFNGGPGSASLWLHMGALGPKRVVVPSNAEDAGAPPYPVVDNGETLLDIADLVFIDPVGTGFSRALGDTEAKTFYGVTEDAEAVSDFVRIWLTRHERWNSPKYLAGESYGTMRAAAMANQLELGSPTVSLNGIILISNFMALEWVTFQEGNELGNLAFLPSYAAAAWYHGKAGEGHTLDEWVEEARRFALGDYAHALLLGNRLGDDARAETIARLAELTGLDAGYIDDANLRINFARFRRELLRDEGKVIGGLDARYTGKEFDDAGETPSADNASTAVSGAFTAAINDYMSRELGVRMDRGYVPSGSVAGEWNWRLPNWRSLLGDPLSHNTAPYIGRAMRRNPDLRVMVAAGYYDLVTPFFDAENAFARNGVVPERISYRYYEAGHMMYVHEPSRIKLLTDLRRFINEGGP